MTTAAPTFPGDEAGPNRGIIPTALKGDNALIFEAALTANFQASEVVDCARASRCALTIRYDADASGTANQLELFVMVSNHTSTPAVADDVWAVLTERDITPAATLQADSMPTNVDVTTAPEWDLRKIRPVYFQTEPSNAGTNKIRLGLVVDVRSWKYIVVLAKEVGDTDADELGALNILAALSA